MSCPFEKAFADVATELVRGGAPPEWLTRALMDFARSIASIGLGEQGDPSCKEVRGRFRRVQSTAENMDRALNAIRDGWLWIPVNELEAFFSTRRAIKQAIEVSDKVLNGIPSGAGRKRLRRRGGPTARQTCAIRGN
jgi:hypothetical protein